MELSEAEFFIDGLLPTGLSFIAGPPKFGKTYLNLQLAVSIASGEDFLGRRVLNRCPVLYLYLEGDAAQVKRRLHDIYGDGKQYPRDLFFVHSVEPYGAVAHISHLIVKYNPGLVIIDTWQLIRSEDTKTRNQTAYMREYNELTALRQELCNKMGVSVLLTHHTKQIGGREKAFDDLNRLNGSTALSGCADAVLLLSGTRGNNRITLTAHGRNFEDAEIVLEKTKPMGWKAAATGTEFQRRLAEVLKGNPLGVSLEQLRTILPEYPYNSIWIQLNRWKASGKITKEGNIYRVKRQDNK